MNATYHKYILYIIISFVFISYLPANSIGSEYDALKGLESIKAVFDVRVANPKVASVHLDLIHKTFKDQNLTIQSRRPDVVVIFMGPAVKMVSKNRKGFSQEEQKYLDTIAATISNMATDGMKLEICVAAVHLTGGDPADILSGIKPVGNGWISAIGYQQKGYALISDF